MEELSRNPKGVGIQGAGTRRRSLLGNKGRILSSLPCHLLGSNGYAQIFGNQAETSSKWNKPACVHRRCEEATPRPVYRQ